MNEKASPYFYEAPPSDESQEVLADIRKFVAELPEDERFAVQGYASQFRHIVQLGGVPARLGMALVSGEFAANHLDSAGLEADLDRLQG